MENYYSKDWAIDFAKEQGCDVVDIMYLDDYLIWYGLGFVNKTLLDRCLERFIICQPGKIKFLDNPPIVKIIPANNLMQKKFVESLPHTNSPYSCYAVMEKGVCVDFLWAAGEIDNFEHSVLILNTIREFNSQIHTLHQLNDGDYIKCPLDIKILKPSMEEVIRFRAIAQCTGGFAPKAIGAKIGEKPRIRGGYFGFDKKGLFRVDINLLKHYNRLETIHWL